MVLGHCNVLGVELVELAQSDHNPGTEMVDRDARRIVLGVVVDYLDYMDGTGATGRDVVAAFRFWMQSRDCAGGPFGVALHER